MLVFPNCKINLGLHITGKRDDGYHNLETVFLPVPWQDALEVIAAPGAAANIEFTSTGLPVSGNIPDNLCVKAYQLLKRDFPLLPPVKMHLHKAIPMGAGLGGGSADAAFTLLLLNQKFRLGITTDGLIKYSLQLGSDCPFFIVNRPCFAEGRGEILSPLILPLTGFIILLVNPGIHVPTGWAFSQITPATPVTSLKQVIKQPVDTWKNELVNDFELPVLKAYPQLQTLKAQLYNAGAVYAGMSGSGSTFFGIFNPGTVMPVINFYPAYLVKQFVLP
ncbi:MAG TPA: 4-(cytidine 5'-diphospho)-2-C-methyl-D-erythritol kinase [Chitinophagaceae bacterium]|nr:4-(cytidine 5'-diphospho)-2-C-methyl-D-erythritol kinase [Chitinophagaceae bacterium]